MERELLITADGSHTIAIHDMQVTYHSRHGAIQESMHVFLKAGLEVVSPLPVIKILEMGFGTGLNALLTLQYAIQHNQPVYYQSFELYPLTPAEAATLNYANQLPENEADYNKLFEVMHGSSWNTDMVIHPLFTLHKTNQSLHDLPLSPAVENVDLIYYDAFAPAAQPDLWTAEMFTKLFHTLKPGGKLVTYCSKSIVRKAMQEAGFAVEKVPGPPGKREMLRATRPVA